MYNIYITYIYVYQYNITRSTAVPFLKRDSTLLIPFLKRDSTPLIPFFWPKDHVHNRRNLNPKQIWIVISLFNLIWHQVEISLVLNHSEMCNYKENMVGTKRNSIQSVKGNYNSNLVQIKKILLCIAISITSE